MVHEKIEEVIDELKHYNLWKTETPSWVTDFSNKSILGEEDFAEWLQFVFLPNLSRQPNTGTAVVASDVAVQAMKFLGDDVKKGKLLRLLVELDSLS